MLSQPFVLIHQRVTGTQDIYLTSFQNTILYKKKEFASMRLVPEGTSVWFNCKHSKYCILIYVFMLILHIYIYINKCYALATRVMT